MSPVVMAVFALFVFGLGAGAMYFMLEGRRSAKPGSKGYPLPEATGMGGGIPTPSPSPAPSFQPASAGTCLLCAAEVEGAPYRCGKCSYRSEWESHPGKQAPIRAVKALRRALELVENVAPSASQRPEMQLGFFAEKGAGRMSPEQAEAAMKQAREVVQSSSEIPDKYKQRILAHSEPIKLKRELDNTIIQLRTSVLMG